MEKDYAKALKAAQSGSERHIERLVSQIGEDAQDVQERRFMVAKRHQDQLRKMEERHQREVNDLNARLEAEIEKRRLLQARSTIIAADLEEAATAGMLHIVNTLTSRDAALESTTSINHAEPKETWETGNDDHEAPLLSYLNSPTLDQKYEDLPSASKVGVSIEDGGKTSDTGLAKSIRPFEILTPGTPNLNFTPREAAASDIRKRRQLVSLDTPSPPTTSSRWGSSGMDSANSSTLSAALYRSQLDHVAVRTKTEDILLRMRKRMAAAKAKEEGLEQLLSQIKRT